MGGMAHLTRGVPVPIQLLHRAAHSDRRRYVLRKPQSSQLNSSAAKQCTCNVCIFFLLAMHVMREG